MIRRVFLVSVALLAAARLAAQVPERWQLRLDRSTNAADPDDVPEVGFRAAEAPPARADRRAR